MPQDDYKSRDDNDSSSDSSSSDDELFFSNDLVLRPSLKKYSSVFFHRGKESLDGLPMAHPDNLPFIRQPALALLKEEGCYHEIAPFEQLPFHLIYQILDYLQDDYKALSAIAATCRKLFLAIARSIPRDEQKVYYPFIQRIFEGHIHLKFDEFLNENGLSWDEYYQQLHIDRLNHLDRKDTVTYLMSRLTLDDILNAASYLKAIEHNKEINRLAAEKRSDWFYNKCLLYYFLFDLLAVFVLGLYGSIVLMLKGESVGGVLMCLTLCSPCLISAAVARCASVSSVYASFERNTNNLFDRYEHYQLRRLNRGIQNPFPQLREKLEAQPADQVEIDVEPKDLSSAI